MEEKNMKTTTIALAVLLALVVAGGAFLWVRHARLLKDLESYKSALTKEMVELQQTRIEYDTLALAHTHLGEQLDSSRAEVARLAEKLKQTQASNFNQIRKYQKELGTLRSIMKSYIVQIDSLSQKNKKLTAELDVAHKQIRQNKREREELSQTVKDLSGQVATGAVLKGRAFAISAFNSSDKKTDRHSRVVRLMASLTLLENDLAPKGPVRVYIRVKSPDGVILTDQDSSDKSFVCAGGDPMKFSASREADYNGQELEMNIYLNGIADFQKGIYSVEFYTEQAKLGEAELMLR